MKPVDGHDALFVGQFNIEVPLHHWGGVVPVGHAAQYDGVYCGLFFEGTVYSPAEQGGLLNPSLTLLLNKSKATIPITIRKKEALCFI